MTKFVALIAAGVLSASALVAGQALADNPNSAFNQVVKQTSGASQASDTLGYGYHAGYISKAAGQNSVSIRSVDELSDAAKASFLDGASQDPAAVQALQAKIAQDANLVRGLQDRHVNVADVIGTSRAFDGSTTYIVR